MVKTSQESTSNTKTDSMSDASGEPELAPKIFNAGSASLDDPLPEFYLNERCFITEYINTDEIPQFSLARTRVEPGVTTQLHTLSVHEWYVIESGSGLMELDDMQQAVSPGAIVQIPRGVNQRITNIGHDDLVFFCVCMPNFTPQSYSTDETD